MGRASTEEPGVIGDNDTLEDAELIDGFGTGKKDNNRAVVTGSLGAVDIPVDEIAPGTEDDGSIDLATDTGVTAEREGATVSAEIGDGPHGSTGTDSGDFDFYSVTMDAGQVLSAAVDTPEGGLDPMVAVWDDAGTLVAFNDDGGPGLDSLAEFAVPADGTYHVMATGFNALPSDPFDSASGSGAGSEGPFVLTVTVGAVDVDGERINTAIFGGPGIRDLSPFRAFLADWGLGEEDYDAVVDVIVDTVEENVSADLEASGLNKNFEVEITNSRDDRDSFGDDNVSRVIGPDTDDASLNFYLTEESDVIEFVGTAVGNVVSHETGHFFGNWHVDQFNDTLNLMDQGGNFPLLYGVGDDGIGGTAEDPDVDFAEDIFNPNEGFTGTEDTLSRVAEVLTK